MNSAVPTIRTTGIIHELSNCGILDQPDDSVVGTGAKSLINNNNTGTTNTAKIPTNKEP